MICLFQIGTCTMAICAKEMNKSFYVVAESFKFARLYPLNQKDVPNQFKVCRHLLTGGGYRWFCVTEE